MNNIRNISYLIPFKVPFMVSILDNSHLEYSPLINSLELIKYPFLSAFNISTTCYVAK